MSVFSIFFIKHFVSKLGCVVLIFSPWNISVFWYSDDPSPLSSAESTSTSDAAITERLFTLLQMSPSTSQLEVAYNPLPVPDRTLEHPSVRDDVRRTIREHKFQPSSTLYTSIEEIYKLYLRDTKKTHSEPVKERFRSALGRVLRPPASSGAYALSFAVDVTRYHGYISIISPECPNIDPRVFSKEQRFEKGRRRRELAKDSKHIEELRERRREKAERMKAQPEEEVPQQISFRYVDEFVSLNCAEDVIRLKLFPNGKELAESMCAFEAVRSYLLTHDKDHPEQEGILSFRDPNVLLLAVGDGVTPRTAGLFAFRTSWRCVSIDPMMRSGAWDQVTNLETHRAKVQDVTIPISSTQDRYERVVVVMWHCHVSIAEAVSCLEIDGVKWDTKDRERSRELRKRIAVVSCACCNYDAVQRVLPDGSRPDQEYEDTGVPGLMRTVRVWKFVK